MACAAWSGQNSAGRHPAAKSLLRLYRQKQRFARENISIASCTIEGWVKQALERLEPLYQQLKFDIKAKGSLQVDETSIKVLESDKERSRSLRMVLGPSDEAQILDWNNFVIYQQASVGYSVNACSGISKCIR